MTAYPFHLALMCNLYSVDVETGRRLRLPAPETADPAKFSRRSGLPSRRHGGGCHLQRVVCQLHNRHRIPTLDEANVLNSRMNIQDDQVSGLTLLAVYVVLVIVAFGGAVGLMFVAEEFVKNAAGTIFIVATGTALIGPWPMAVWLTKPQGRMAAPAK